MINKKLLGMGATALLVLGLAVIWGSNGKGVIKSDPDRNLAIPDTLQVPLQVRASYNGEKIFFSIPLAC